MKDFEITRGMKITEFHTGNDLYEIYTTWNCTYPYAGYVNGKLSVTATHADIAVSGLQRKHITRLPERRMIDFQTAIEDFCA